MDPAVGIFVAVLLAALIGLLVWFIATRGNDTNGSSDNNPRPQQSTSQQTDRSQPTAEPSAATTP